MWVNFRLFIKKLENLLQTNVLTIVFLDIQQNVDCCQRLSDAVKRMYVILFYPFCMIGIIWLCQIRRECGWGRGGSSGSMSRTAVPVWPAPWWAHYYHWQPSRPGSSHPHSATPAAASSLSGSPPPWCWACWPCRWPTAPAPARGSGRSRRGSWAGGWSSPGRWRGLCEVGRRSASTGLPAVCWASSSAAPPGNSGWTCSWRRPWRTCSNVLVRSEVKPSQT